MYKRKKKAPKPKKDLSALKTQLKNLFVVRIIF